MPEFSKVSEKRLSECEWSLQKILRKAILIVDFSVVTGHRGQEDQNRLFREGKSKLPWPHGKHNKKPSRAVDIQPYPNTTDPKVWFYLIGIIMGIAHAHGIRIRSGADWDMDTDFSDQTFNDWYHLELA